MPCQLALDLFPSDRKSPYDASDRIEELVEAGCPRGVVEPMVRDLYLLFRPPEAYDRSVAIAYIYGRRPVRNLVGCDPVMLGVFDRGIDYHVLWDRCWAAHWVPLAEALRVRMWHYGNYRQPYTGAPVYVWYIDNDGREVKRPYEG